MKSGMSVMNIKTFAFSILMSAALISGCAQQGTPANGGTYGAGNPYGSGGTGGAYGTGSGYGPGYGNGAGNGYGMGNGSGQYNPADLRNPSSILAQRIIYFAFDSSNIRPEFMNVLNAHASLLAANPSMKIRLEGHADERGSRDYNVALSERRGYAVLDYMQLKGVQANQMEVIGYGEEIPADFGHNESAWSKNRRVEIKYAGE
jgi:peptidoglycan-associated lipoprotein